MRLLPLAGVALLLAGCAGFPGPAVQVAPGTVFRDCEHCPEMVVVAPGRYVRGTTSADPDRWDDLREAPAHEVTIARPFAIARHETTRGQFARFAAETGHHAPGCTAWSGKAWATDPARDWQRPGFPQADDEPVVCVSWHDARAFAEWLSRRTGAHYRLPTEAEWEYAARAGTTSVRFWGDGMAEACLHANVGDRSLGALGGVADCDDGHTYTSPVGRYRPNPWGLFDMLGNVWEWTEDCWHLGYAGAPVDGSARTDGDCAVRVPRGASWNSHYRNVRSANRGSYRAADRYNHIGFRLVRGLEEAGGAGRN